MGILDSDNSQMRQQGKFKVNISGFGSFASAAANSGFAAFASPEVKQGTGGFGGQTTSSATGCVVKI